MSFLIQLRMMSVNVGKSVSIESIRTFTEIQLLMGNIFIFKDFKTIYILSHETLVQTL